MRTAGVLAGLATALSLAAASAVVDACRYANDAAAQAAWRPMRGSAEARASAVDGTAALRLPCNFAGTTFERASWDRRGKLNLAPYEGVELRVKVSSVAPVARFNIYFQSGAGWYSASFFPDSSRGWSTIEIPKASTHVEGKPSGWSEIETIRISAWRAKDADTDLYIGGLRGYGVLGEDAATAIVRADSVSGDSRGVAEYAALLGGHLSALGVRHATLSDLEVSAAQLKAARLVILPYNTSLPDRAATELARYLQGGGKVISFYGLPAKLRAAAKIEGGGHVRAQFSGLRFAEGALPGAPAVVGQRSWNFAETKPVAGASRVLAEWLDEQGKPTGQAAVVASANCIVMTHVLLRDDAANKRRMLAAMIGRLAPQVLRPAVAASLERMGRIGGASGFDDAAARIGRGDKGVAAARKLRQQASMLSAKGDYAAALARVADANQQLLEAYARSQKPEKGEFRAFWCHSAFGVQGMEWDEAIRRLAENGFNAIVPNMLWGGAAFYPSDVLPAAASLAGKGDQIEQALAACRKYGVQMHVWKVNWNLGGHAPAAFIEKMKREGRVQVSSRGKQEPWLCPSHPENQKLEIASMVEVARKYAVDGIHFDYIRYPDGDHCFCEGCRARFSKAVGATLAEWPREVMAEGRYRKQWLDWRRSNITAVVQAVSEQARRARPTIRISAAVFRNWAVDRDGVGQDWKLWCERGWLDFVCPMDYTDSGSQFDAWVTAQKEWAGRTPVYPGIGASSSSSSLAVDSVIGQIRTARAHRAGGFVIFNYGVSEARELLPMLGLGVTRR
jgi:uncharacterized lipoprotein YddW (UPF0748 family)